LKEWARTVRFDMAEVKANRPCAFVGGGQLKRGRRSIWSYRLRLGGRVTKKVFGADTRLHEKKKKGGRRKNP